MEKPVKRYNSRPTYSYYYSVEMDTYLTDLLAPLKEAWRIKDGHYEQEAIKQLAERLNW